MSEKIIMVIAGTFWQIPILKKIKAMGYKSLCVNLYENSPAFPFADYHEVCDILDREKCLEIARKYNISAVISEECDIAMPTVGYISDKLELNSLSLKDALLYTNKFLMREFGIKNNLPTPAYRLCKNTEELQEFLKEQNKHIILKPLDANSSRGVYTIEPDDKDIEPKFKDALSYSKNEKAVLAEQYINGTEFTVDGITVNGNHYVLAISEKKHYEHNENIANQLYFSNYNENFNYDLIRKVNSEFVKLSGLKDGCLTHAEYKYENGIFYLIEIAARGGGNLISAEIVPIMSGVDNYKVLINSSLGIPVEDIKIDESLKDRCCVLYFFDTPGTGGFVKEILGEDVLKSSKNVVKYAYNFKIGDEIKKAANDAARIGYYIAYADTKKELDDLMTKINSSFGVVFE